MHRQVPPTTQTRYVTPLDRGIHLIFYTRRIFRKTKKIDKKTNANLSIPKRKMKAKNGYLPAET